MPSAAEASERAEGVPSAVNAVRSVLTSQYGFYERLARRRADSPSDAADILQSFALKALERAGQLRESCAVRGWLRRVFETSVIDYFRGKTKIRQREVSQEAAGTALENVISPPSFVDETQLIHATLARLKSDYADIICRVDLQDQATEQVADELGITVNNLAVRLHRARTAFRAALDQGQIPRAHASSMPRYSGHAVCHPAKRPLEMGRRLSALQEDGGVTVQ